MVETNPTVEVLRRARSDGRRVVAVVQPCSIPWKGYFDLIALSDAFVFLDTVQFVRRHWFSRNRIKTAQGLKWLSIPAAVRGRRDQVIAEVEISAPFVENHLATLFHAYSRAPHFQEVWPLVEAAYTAVADEIRLSALDQVLVELLCGHLGIASAIRRASDLPDHDDPTGRLVGICQGLDAHIYLSGPAAQAYLDVDAFEAAGIEVVWMDYSGYPEYPQLHGPFEHAVSILDMLFMLGPEGARDHMLSPLD